MPDEFEFFLDVEDLGRLSRELLIEMLPLYVDTWSTLNEPVTELHVGGLGSVLSKDERAALTEAMNQVRADYSWKNLCVG